MILEFTIISGLLTLLLYKRILLSRKNRIQTAIMIWFEKEIACEVNRLTVTNCNCCQCIAAHSEIATACYWGLLLELFLTQQWNSNHRNIKTLQNRKLERSLNNWIWKYCKTLLTLSKGKSRHKIKGAGMKPNNMVYLKNSYITKN